jgi:transposase
MVDTRARGYNSREEAFVANRQTFTKEFKDQAVGLVVEQGRLPADVAKSLGIKVGTLKWWLREHRRADVKFQAVEDSTLRRRVRELEAQLQRVTMEREILKKATLYFAREQS